MLVNLFIGFLVIGSFVIIYSAMMIPVQKKIRNFFIRTSIDLSILYGTLGMLYCLGKYAHSNIALDVLLFIVGRFVFLGEVALFVWGIPLPVTFTVTVIIFIIFLLWKANFEVSWQQLNQSWKAKMFVFIVLCVGGANSIFSLSALFLLVVYAAFAALVHVGTFLLHFPMCTSIGLVIFMGFLYYLYKKSVRKAILRDKNKRRADELKALKRKLQEKASQENLETCSAVVDSDTAVVVNENVDDENVLIEEPAVFPGGTVVNVDELIGKLS